MTVIHEYEGWVLTDGGIVSHGCLLGPFKSIVRCPRCGVWLTEKIFKHMERTWNFVKAPDEPELYDPGKPVYARRR